jgi:hypothetical protein
MTYIFYFNQIISKTKCLKINIFKNYIFKSIKSNLDNDYSHINFDLKHP